MARVPLLPKRVVRMQSYVDDLNAIEQHIALDDPIAAVEMWFAIDDQVEQLADPNFPRRPGRVPDTKELVAHPNYLVILEESAQVVTVLNVVHARQKWP